MKNEINEINLLANKVNSFINYQDKIKKIKGETFNIFSILQVETKENKTHSNFIAELLNPKGSHLQGSIFLEQFLETINYTEKLDIKTVEVIKEYHIGKKSESDGGRIDILIRDSFNNIISIENKINAGDQENQVIRYCNFNKNKNKVYYLTLFGNIPSDFSIKDENILTEKEDFKLENDKDYFTLSYSYDIIKWLEKCLEKSVNIHQLRESIKQYIQLVQKLTHQNMEEREKLIDILFENHRASEKIALVFNDLRDHIRYQFREDVVKRLKENLSSKFAIRTPNPIHKKNFAQIFVSNEKLDLEPNIFEILIESFNDSGHYNGDVFLGLLDFKKEFKDYPINKTLDFDFDTEYWKTKEFININNKKVNFRDNDFLNQIKNPNTDSYTKILDSFTEQCLDFIEVNTIIMEEYFNKKQLLTRLQ